MPDKHLIKMGILMEENKSLIIKYSDIEKYLDDKQKSELSSISNYIHSCLVNENRRLAERSRQRFAKS